MGAKLQYYLQVGARVFGPYDEQTVRGKLASGAIEPEILASTDRVNWAPVCSVLDSVSRASSVSDRFSDSDDGALSQSSNRATRTIEPQETDSHEKPPRNAGGVQEWYVAPDGKTGYGVFSAGELVEMLRSKEITMDALIWRGNEPARAIQEEPEIVRLVALENARAAARGETQAEPRSFGRAPLDDSQNSAPKTSKNGVLARGAFDSILNREKKETDLNGVVNDLFVKIGGKAIYGPFSAAKVCESYDTGLFDDSAFIWRKGGEQKRLGDVIERLKFETRPIEQLYGGFESNAAPNAPSIPIEAREKIQEYDRKATNAYAISWISLAAAAVIYIAAALFCLVLYAQEEATTAREMFSGLRGLMLVGSFGISAILFIVGGAAGACLVYYFWKAIPEEYAQVTPARAVVFLFAPIFNLYWIFVVFRKGAIAANLAVRDASAKGGLGVQEYPPTINDGLATVLCIFAVLGLGVGIPLPMFLIGHPWLTTKMWKTGMWLNAAKVAGRFRNDGLASTNCGE